MLYLIHDDTFALSGGTVVTKIAHKLSVSGSNSAHLRNFWRDEKFDSNCRAIIKNLLMSSSY